MWIEGEPVPKSTMPPPVVKKRMSPRARAFVVQKIINENEYYAPIKKTQAYQKYVADCVLYLPPPFPQFDKLDPIKVTLTFYKGKHGTGDLKNLIAAVEDGIQYSGRIPNDRQITTHGPKQIYYYSDNPGADVVVEIAPIASDYEWLLGWLNNSKKKLERYLAMREITLEK